MGVCWRNNSEIRSIADRRSREKQVETCRTACHSSLTCIHTSANAAATMPTDWIMKLKSRATAGLMPSASVITGKATAAPPSEVAPATSDPNTMVTLISQRGLPSADLRKHESRNHATHNQNPGSHV